MRRRDVIAMTTLLLFHPMLARAQRLRRPVIGVLWHAGSEEEEAPYLNALRQGLRDVGYVPGETLVLENRFPAEQYERFQSLAAELVGLKPDVLVVVTPAAALAAQRATATIPIVFVLVADPVGLKLVNSWSSPGSNITGFSQTGLDLSGKRLELLKEIAGEISRVGLLVNPGDPSQPPIVRQTEHAGRALGITVVPAEVTAREEIEPAFGRMLSNGVQGVVVPPDGLFFRDRGVIAELALRHRLPLLFWSKETVEAGGLASYGPSVPAIFRRAAVYVDKILKGEKPGNLPVEQPTRYEMIINLKTAKALGLEIPPTLLARADEVIE